MNYDYGTVGTAAVQGGREEWAAQRGESRVLGPPQLTGLRARSTIYS